MICPYRKLVILSDKKCTTEWQVGCDGLSIAVVLSNTVCGEEKNKFGWVRKIMQCKPIRLENKNDFSPIFRNLFRCCFRVRSKVDSDCLKTIETLLLTFRRVSMVGNRTILPVIPNEMIFYICELWFCNDFPSE